MPTLTSRALPARGEGKSPDPVEAEVDQRLLEARQIRLYIENTPDYVRFAVPAFAVAVALVWPLFPGEHPKLLLWAAANFATHFARLAAWVAFKRARPEDGAIRPWLKWFFVPQICGVSVISASTILFLPASSGNDLELTVVFSAFVGAIALAGTLHAAAYRPLIAPVLAAAVLIFGVGTIRLPGTLYVLLALAAPVAGLFIYRLASRFNQAFVRSMELSIRNERLAAEQAAVREVLEAISRSVFDLDAVLRTLIESATRLCRAEKGLIFRFEDGEYRLAVGYGGVTQEFREFIVQHPIRAGRDTLVGRTALEKRTVHIEDVLADPEYRWTQAQRICGYRTLLGVPIVRDDVVIGVIAMWKERVEPFTPAQIQLLNTFSSQASIAIENVRLFNETKEVLEQQTATADILRVISSSPTDIQPVLDAVASTAARLCGASEAVILRIDGDVLRFVAHYGSIPPPAIAEDLPLDRGLVSGRAVIDRRTIHAHDLAAADEAEFPLGGAFARRFGQRTVLSTPLLRRDSLSGRSRSAACRFARSRQADQAARDFAASGGGRRTRYSRSSWRATGAALRGPERGDHPCRRGWCGAPHRLSWSATGGAVRHFPVPLSEASGNGQAILRRRVMHYPDSQAPDVPEYARRGTRIRGDRALLIAPMLRGGTRHRIDLRRRRHHRRVLGQADQPAQDLRGPSGDRDRERAPLPGASGAHSRASALGRGAARPR